MISKVEFDKLCTQKDHGVLILDGALATELEFRGYELDGSIWSAEILRKDPKAIEQVHLDYYLARADVAITASYQASVQGLVEHCGLSDEESCNLIRLSVKLAQQAREKVCSTGSVPHDRKLLVAGSAGPYGAYLADGSEYRGDYARTAEQFKDFHRPRIAALIDAGVDLLALETMPNIVEIRALLSMFRDEYPETIYWLSCTVRDASHLSDGTPLGEVARVACQHDQQLIGLGVNCVRLEIVSDTLENLSEEWKGSLVSYPNSGEVYDGATHTWSGAQAQTKISQHALRWRAAGARLIGGCCRTRPDDIRQLVKNMHRD